MFKSVLSQHILCTVKCCWSFACFLYFFFFRSLEITHNAWPNKLADYHVGQGVIRRRQYQSASIQYQDQLLWPHASAFPHIVNTALLLRKCSQHAATCPPIRHPECHIRLCSSACINCYCVQVSQRDMYCILQHMCRIEMPSAALF